MERYLNYSQYLQQKYGEKVYKIPISIPCTCPNRDGNLGVGGCIYCGEKAVGYENLPTEVLPKDQYLKNTGYIRKKYKSNKFIPYFQNYTNTYIPLDRFKEYIEQVCVSDVVGIAIATRPDCIDDRYLHYLLSIYEEYNIDITIEFGLQTPNYHTLNKINRGHTLAEFIDGVAAVKKYPFEICTHVILNLPWDDEQDAVECAKILSALKINAVKSHALYIEKNTPMAQMYIDETINMISLEEYIHRVILFLEYLDPQIAIQRLIGRAPKENTLFVNWNRSWWIIKDMIQEEMEARNTYQGKKFHYLGGKALVSRKS
ncbi:MAG: TIGR01212 family radical SAM protein [Eubacteriales bacterium]